MKLTDIESNVEFEIDPGAIKEIYDCKGYTKVKARVIQKFPCECFILRDDGLYEKEIIYKEIDNAKTYKVLEPVPVIRDRIGKEKRR